MCVECNPKYNIYPHDRYKAHIANTTIQDKDIEAMADSILSKMWHCEDSISFATSLRTHGQNFRRIAARSIGERDPTDVRSVVSQFQFMFKKGWTNAVRARVSAGLTQGNSSGVRERPKRIWACPYCTFVLIGCFFEIHSLIYDTQVPS